MPLTKVLVIGCVAGIAVAVLGGVAGLVVLSDATDDQIQATLGSCPSQLFPVRPGSSLNETSTITVGWPARSTTGCWTSYSAVGSPKENFDYYAAVGKGSDWDVLHTYPQTGNLELLNRHDSTLHVLIQVSGKESALFWAPGRTRVDLSVCARDPQILQS